jgi:hypothetical protein
MSSQVGKLNMVNQKLGATMKGQQTTRTIFDTVTASAAGAVQYNFFQTFNGKTALETNLTTNKLDSSESMVIKSIYLAIDPGNAGTLTAQGMMNLNIIVGNQVVLKDFPINFNAGGRGVAFDRLHSAPDNEIVEVRLATDIVIPPQVNFQANLLLAETLSLVDTKLTMELKGYGVIFSAGATF